MPPRKHIFVGRKTELEQFQQVIGQTGKTRSCSFASLFDLHHDSFYICPKLDLRRNALSSAVFLDA